MGKLKRSLLVAFALTMLAVGAAQGDPGTNWCITPAFVSGNIPPNLLLMIDNSASMYDLAYVDEGKRNCSGSSTTPCTTDADCGTGQTCTDFDRRPFYCYDETYQSTKEYYGYFDKDKFYYYRSGTDDFAQAAGTTLAAVIATSPSTCGTGTTTVTKTIPNTMCVEYANGNPKTLTAFVAKGNYLNWLTASKFDTEKQILTGGKFDGSSLLPESRGCVGQGFVKDANVGDFVNFSTGTPDPNHSLQVTFTVNGPVNNNNPTAPSTGGQTYINLYAGASYNYSTCQDAVQAYQTANDPATIKQKVDACLQSVGTPTGSCKNMPSTPSGKTPLPTVTCGTNSDCYLSTANSGSAYVCQYYPSRTCTGTSDATSCVVPARNSCSLDTTIACTLDSQCVINVAAKPGTCSTSKSMYAPAPGKNDSPPVNKSCTVDSDCNFRSTGTNFIAQSGACVGYQAATSTNKGPCVNSPQLNYGPCTYNYVGDCALSAQAAQVKTNVTFAQSMQECWKIRGQTHTAADSYGFSNVNTIKNQCPDIYASYRTCRNNRLQQCSDDTECGTNGPCDIGPNAISSGSSALLCGTNYAGQYFEQNSRGQWVMKSTATDLDLDYAEYRFCKQMETGPNVMDPTDSPSDTSTTENLPAILSGIGVEGQLGSPVARMRAKVAVSTPACTASTNCGTGKSCIDGTCQPSGLIQQFASQMRIGAMTFNKYGVGNTTESALSGVGLTKVCSDNANQICTQNVDCNSNNCQPTVIGTSNFDGAGIIYPIGNGFCTTMTGDTCRTDADCPLTAKTCYNNRCGNKSTTAVCTTALTCSGSNQACVPNGAGGHTTSDSLVQKIDSIPANAWTPFAESYYNALGYFAAKVQNDGSITGRTDLRLNSDDFVETLHPSEYRCQQNYLLLVTDGTSTADRNSTVSGLASLYATASNTTAGDCSVATGQVDHGGTSNLPVLSWIGRHENLAAFSTSAATAVHCSVSTTTSCVRDSDCPSGETCTNAASPRDYLTTYVVFNGSDTGSTDVCSAENLLNKTAINGGTTLEKASDPEKLTASLTLIFQNIAAKASSGTAASILSNSEGSGANILQAVFYPKKIFYDDTSVKWIGEMQNLWYFVDPMINHSTIREDTSYTSGDTHTLDLIANKVVSLRFDPTDNTTYAYTSIDQNGDGTGDTTEVKEDADQVKSIWRAGKLLWARDLSASPRSIRTTLDGSSLVDFATTGTTADKNNWARYLNVAADEVPTLMDYVKGSDQSGYRGRQVKIKESDDTVGTGTWRLGDIISSTPRIQSNVKLNSYSLSAPSGYSDASYSSFINSNQYRTRGMVYVGANDGMLHAFKLGLLDVNASGTQKAKLTGTNLGREEWAYIPKQALPYLKYYTDPYYNHLYYVDGSTVVVDASIGNTTDCTGSYDTCPKLSSVVDGNNDLSAAKNTWRTVLVGGMGLGGSSALSCSSGSNCVATPIADPDDGSKGLGYSSYFALDVTDPENPSLLWEFSNTSLGYATTGPAIVRVGDSSHNGKWFAVFGSGPTGRIDTSSNQFLGFSDQKLRFFVVDLRTGELKATITTDIDNAFAGSMVGGAIDADRWNPSTAGNYQDDAIYAGYTQKTGTSWTDGGVLRIVTKESTDPSTWTWSRVIDNTGPVTSAISRLQDRKNKKLWLYFGTGRYYSRVGTTVDDKDSLRAIYGIKDPCYNTDQNPGNLLDKTCMVKQTTESRVSNDDTPITGSITNQSTSITDASSIAVGGWKVTLDRASGNYGAERVVTDAVALTNGTIFVTSFEPTADPCGFGGNSFIWALDYKSGGRPDDAALGGKALIQLSTGEFREVDLTQAFGAGASRLNRRANMTMTGKPPADAFPVISKSANRPVKRILHIQER